MHTVCVIYLTSPLTILSIVNGLINYVWMLDKLLDGARGLKTLMSVNIFQNSHPRSPGLAPSWNGKRRVAFHCSQGDCWLLLIVQNQLLESALEVDQQQSTITLTACSGTLHRNLNASVPDPPLHKRKAGYLRQGRAVIAIWCAYI